MRLSVIWGRCCVIALAAAALTLGMTLSPRAANIQVESEVWKCIGECPDDQFRCELYCRCVVAYVDEHYTEEEYQRLEAAAANPVGTTSAPLRARLRALKARAEDCALDAFAG